MILDGRTVQSTPESGSRAGYDGYKRRNGSKTHVAVDTLGYLLATVVTPTNEQERAQVGGLAAKYMRSPASTSRWRMLTDGYTSDAAASAAIEQGIVLEIVKLPDATCSRSHDDANYCQNVSAEHNYRSSILSTDPSCR